MFKIDDDLTAELNEESIKLARESFRKPTEMEYALVKNAVFRGALITINSVRKKLGEE